MMFVIMGAGSVTGKKQHNLILTNYFSAGHMIKHSNSFSPDLDWTQIRETAKLLNLSAGQVSNMLETADVSVNTLTDSFTSMVEHMQIIYNHLQDLDETPSREEALKCCAETSIRIQDSIVAFQFYDRLQQCLLHVTSN